MVRDVGLYHTYFNLNLINMKTLIFIPFFFICSIVMAQSTNIIGTPFKLGYFEVAQDDFPNRMEWNDAIKACSELGNGWRLPTKYELNYLYIYRGKIGRFANNDYWSSTEEDMDNAWRQYFNGGSQALLFKVRGFANVRAVRTIKP